MNDANADRGARVPKCATLGVRRPPSSTAEPIAAATRLLITTSVPSTLTAFLLPFARHFRERGFVVHAASNGVTSCDACREAFDEVFELPWTRRPRDPANVIEAPRRLRALVRARRYDLVHAHDPVAAFVTRFALRNVKRSGRPRVVYTAHGFHFHGEGGRLSNLAFLAAERLAGRWTDYLVVINRDDEREAKRHRIVPSDRLRYMPGIGVDLDHYDAGRVTPAEVRALRAEIGVDERAPLLTMVGEFNPGKRHRDAVRAVALARRRDVHLVLAGVGPLMDDVRELACSLEVANRVHLLGYRTDVPTLMAAAFATILPSEREGLPRCIMESMCLERPVIATRIRGVRELVDEETGILTDVGDVEAMARAIDTLADDGARANRLGWRGRERIRAFDLHRVLALHDELYAEALADAG